MDAPVSTSVCSKVVEVDYLPSSSAGKRQSGYRERQTSLDDLRYIFINILLDANFSLSARSCLSNLILFFI